MEFGEILYRTVALFAIALAVVRIMGNKTIGQLTPFDFVLMVSIGDIMANVALDREESLLSGLEALVTIGALGLFTSYIALKNRRARMLLEGKPITIIKDGQILRENMNRCHLNMDDLKQEIHKVGVDLSKLDDVKEARLEACGTFTVIKKDEAEAVTVKDMNQLMQTIQGQQSTEQQPNQNQQDIQQLIGEVKRLVSVVKRQEAEHYGKAAEELR